MTGGDAASRQFGANVLVSAGTNRPGDKCNCVNPQLGGLGRFSRPAPLRGDETSRRQFVMLFAVLRGVLLLSSSSDRIAVFQGIIINSTVSWNKILRVSLVCIVAGTQLRVCIL